MPMSEEELEDFYKIKDKLIKSEALASPDFSDLDKQPLIMGLDFSIKAMCVTISQVQKCLDGSYRQRLLFCLGRKCSPSGQNWLSHHGESATFVWGLTTYVWLLKQAPFLVETDSMSVKYIDTMKNSRSSCQMGQADRVVLLHDHTCESHRGRLCLPMSQPPARANSRRA